MKRCTLSQEIKNIVINDYLDGMSYREVAVKYNVDHKTVMYWELFYKTKINILKYE